MTNLLFYNNAVTTLAGPVGSTDTTCTVASGSGSLFLPGPTGSQYFCLTFSDASTGLTNEIVHVTNVTGDVLTIVRAQEGTTAQNWNTGDNASAYVTAGMLNTLATEAAPTADKLTTARNISMTGDTTWTVLFDGSGDVTAAGTLATVNASPGTYGNATSVAQLTVNGKGLVTAASTVAITSAPKWTTARTLSFTGDATGSGSVDGSASVATALTLATVNGSPGTFGSPYTTVSLTINGKGLITASSAVTSRVVTATSGSWTGAGIAGNAVGSVAHGLGSTPNAVQGYIRCLTAELGYSIGDTVAVNFGGSSRNDGVTMWCNASNVGFAISTNGIAVTAKGGGAGSLITPANWWLFAVVAL